MNSKSIESIQRRAALICTGAYKHTEHVKLLKDLGWHDLKSRRIHHSLCLYYKLIKKLGPAYCNNLLPQPVSNLTNYNLRSQSNLRTPRMRLTSTKTFFFSYTTELWNNLPESIKQSPLLTILKKLTAPKLLTSNYNRLCSGYYGRLLTRLRLGLSGLNAHMFKYNLTNTPTCSQCLLAPEDNLHYFFYCPAHELARQHLLNLLQSELDLDTSNIKHTLDIILYGNIHHNNYPILLQSIYQYIKLTGRFENH